MKKMLCLLGVLGLLLSGCGRGAEEALPAEEAAEMQQTLLETAVPLSEGGEMLRPMTEDEVLAAYQQAARIWSWFELKPMDLIGERRTVDGVSYWQVDPAEMVDMNALRAQLCRHFTEELAEELLATGGEHPLYREIDQQLYVTSGGRERDPLKGRQQVEVLRQSDTCYLVSVTVDLLDVDQVTVVGLECWTFPYELVGDQWLFTDFRLVS